MSVLRLSDSDFKNEVLQSKQLILVDFWAPWCAPCRMVAPVLEELAKEYNDRVKICKINVDESQAMAAKYQILSIPALLFFKEGKVVAQLIGAQPAADIKKTIDSLL